MISERRSQNKSGRAPIEDVPMRRSRKPNGGQELTDRALGRSHAKQIDRREHAGQFGATRPRGRGAEDVESAASALLDEIADQPSSAKYRDTMTVLPWLDSRWVRRRRGSNVSGSLGAGRPYTTRRRVRQRPSGRSPRPRSPRWRSRSRRQSFQSLPTGERCRRVRKEPAITSSILPGNALAGLVVVRRDDRDTAGPHLCDGALDELELVGAEAARRADVARSRREMDLMVAERVDGPFHDHEAVIALLRVAGPERLLPPGSEAGESTILDLETHDLGGALGIPMSEENVASAVDSGTCP